MANEQQPQPPQPLAGIKGDTLFVQVPLNAPNGELMAYGFLTMAEHMVQDFFLQKRIQAELAQNGKLSAEKAKIDIAVASR